MHLFKRHEQAGTREPGIAIALRVGTTEPTVNRWRNGEQIPTDKWVPMLTRLFRERLGDVDENYVALVLSRSRRSRAKSKAGRTGERLDALEATVSRLTQILEDFVHDESPEAQ
ncbi:MAG: hypothetical protein JWO62_52 [Acidimicrobiaceae bacterium]|nr:hypothetical protein [Acidimicrobiaceae bacterium]